MSNIPRDVIQLHILPRLAVKSLTRFKSVSKSWQTWIGSPDFIRLHRQHVRSSDKNRFLVMLDEESHTLHLHELDSPSAPPLLLLYPESATCTTPMPVEIVSSCEFMVLLSCFPRYNIFTQKDETYELVLLNPSTGSYHKIPHPSLLTYLYHYHKIHGLYFDEANDDYKVALICQSNDCYFSVREVMIYRCKTNSWTLIEHKMDMFNRIEAQTDVAVIGQLLHTSFNTENDDDNFTISICCFDIVAEQWTNNVPLPDRFDVDNLKYDFAHNRLCVFDGLLSVGVENIVCNRRNYQVWVMKEYGVKESWVRLWNIDIQGHKFLPVNYRDGSRHNILCRKRSTWELFWYNIITKKARKVKFDGCRKFDSDHVVCKQSLVNFAGGRQIKLRRLEIKKTRKRRRG